MDLTVLVVTRSITMREVMKKVQEMAKTEKVVISCSEIKREMASSDE